MKSLVVLSTFPCVFFTYMHMCTNIKKPVLNTILQSAVVLDYFLRFIFCFITYLVNNSLAVLGLRCCVGSLVAESRGFSWLLCVGCSSRWLLSPRGTGAVLGAHGLSCSAACVAFLGQGSNPCLLHWQVDSTPEPFSGSFYILP